MKRVRWVLVDLPRFDMGGCFPCFGSSNKGGNGAKEVVKKDSFKDGSAAVSHHVDRVSSGISSRYFLGFSFFFPFSSW